MTAPTSLVMRRTRTAASPADRALERKLAAAAAAVSFAVALLLPAVYFVAGNNSQHAILQTEAEINAKLAMGLVARPTEASPAQRRQLEELLAARPQQRVAEIRTITTPRGEVVGQVADRLEAPTITETAQIRDGRSAIGTLRISRSLRPLLVDTAAVALLAITLGLLSYLAVRAALGALRAALARLLDAQRHNADMERQKKAGEAAAQLKAEFLANMSHEVRTPLNGALGMTELLLGTKLDGEQRKMVETAHRSSRVLIRVLGDALELSKIEAGKLELQDVAFDLRALVDEVSARIEREAHAQESRFVCGIASDVPATVAGDPARLRQILLNLLRNAVRVSTGREVSLDVALEWNAGDAAQVLFTVRDSGGGMDAKALSSMFKPFTHADEAMSRRHGGTGLALAISKQLVERMGGEIQVESAVGRGTIFRCRVPLRITAAPAAKPHAGRPARAARGSALHVLLAEDDTVNQQVASAMLTRAGYAVTIADNGAKAVQALLDASYDLVLMDCQMPELDGFAATAAIRGREAADPAARRVPVVALTANAMDGDRKRCLSSGFDDFLAKPFKKNELIAIVERWTHGEPAKRAA